MFIVWNKVTKEVIAQFYDIDKAQDYLDHCIESEIEDTLWHGLWVDDVLIDNPTFRQASEYARLCYEIAEYDFTQDD